MCVEGGPCQISDTNEWPTCTKAHIKLGFSVTALLFGRDLSTANSASEHIHVIPQPPKRVPVERVKTRGFIRSQAVPFGKKQEQVHLDWMETPCWKRDGGGLTSAHKYHNTEEVKEWEHPGLRPSKNGSVRQEHSQVAQKARHTVTLLFWFDSSQARLTETRQGIVYNQPVPTWAHRSFLFFESQTTSFVFGNIQSFSPPQCQFIWKAEAVVFLAVLDEV